MVRHVHLEAAEPSWDEPCCPWLFPLSYPLPIAGYNSQRWLQQRMSIKHKSKDMGGRLFLWYNNAFWQLIFYCWKACLFLFLMCCPGAGKQVPDKNRRQSSIDFQDEMTDGSLPRKSGTDCMQPNSGLIGLPGGIPWLPSTIGSSCAGVSNMCTGTWTCEHVEECYIQWCVQILPTAVGFIGSKCGEDTKNDMLVAALVTSFGGDGVWWHFPHW